MDAVTYGLRRHGERPRVGPFAPDVRRTGRVSLGGMHQHAREPWPGPGTTPRGPVAARTSLTLAVVAAAASVVTLLPDVLHGTPVMNGSARGTAVVVLVAAVPTLVAGVLLAGRKRLLGPPLWLGALALMAYNAVMFCFATPFNRAFPLYVAMLGLAVAALVTGLRASDPRRYVVRGRARLVAVWIGVVAVANTALWLATVVPAVVDDDSSFLDGTGLTTNPVFVQDLAFWLPLAMLVGWWLWRRRRWGGLLAAGLLVFWVLESATVAVDQWLGSAADPSSDLATREASYLFIGLGVVGLGVLWAFLRSLDRRPT